MNPFIILSAAQMRAAEAAAIAGGTASAALMETAGEKTVSVIVQTFSRRPVAVICGPGNNGGDGFVIARELAQAGWPVKVALLGDRAALTGDAKLMADLFEGEAPAFSPAVLEGAGLIVDAIFGTGLSRPVEDAAKAAIEAMNAHPAPVVAVDIPSGVDADTGAVLGTAIQAVRTVTFHARKPGHVLFPGRALSGAIDIADIAIDEEATQKAGVGAFENHPALWGGMYPRPQWGGHKYHRGAAMILSGGALTTGAARLAAQGALRIGAGLVTMLSPSEAAPVHAAHLTAIMLRIADTADQVRTHLVDAERIRMVCVAGPATGMGALTKEKILAILNSKAGAVLDADALTSFADNPTDLFAALRPGDVLTPHEGEFARLFPEETKLSGKLAMARAASEKAGCVIVLKGADTVIAAPDGRALINTNAPPDLATAGSGDVLAGFIAGLKVQGSDGFAAAGQGVWIHGACGQVVGAGLIAEDLPQAVPTVLRQLFAPPQQPERQASGGEGGAQQ
ncbi:NAD(P)H-hydrate dehydratase [Hyphococcus sp.]|uniref:NAD(P)H-hydrate dehydratase n=1 Tax=Hyphococcus sp. TaxID=2038636 RepID=UPI0020850492|nr:MAG: bifunctional NAD(P)H-hydrate repair enzyme [Marinicaulis sp.]